MMYVFVMYTFWLFTASFVISVTYPICLSTTSSVYENCPVIAVIVYIQTNKKIMLFSASKLSAKFSEDAVKFFSFE